MNATVSLSNTAGTSFFLPDLAITVAVDSFLSNPTTNDSLNFFPPLNPAKPHSSAFVSAGYGNIITFQYGEMPVSHQFNEHRIWEQFTQKSTIGRVDIQHRYRLEQRILDNYVKSGAEYLREGTVFRQRVRYRALAFIPLNHASMSDNTLFLNVNDEIFLGFGEGIGTNILDQNRLQIALGWKFNAKCMIQAGYMNQYVSKNAKVSLANTLLDQAENNNTLTIGLTYNFDFSKKEETK